MNANISERDRVTHEKSPHRKGIIGSLKGICEHLEIEYPEISYAELGPQYDEDVAWLARLNAVTKAIKGGLINE